MKFCQAHWDTLRQKIDDVGMTSLVAKDGETAVKMMQQQMLEQKDSKETFDPLMSSHWAIVNNIMHFLDEAGINPLYLIAAGPEDPVDVAQAGEKYAGRTWPKCPLCYINLAHELSCKDEGCFMPKENGYDWVLDRAVGDALDKARKLKLVPEPS